MVASNRQINDSPAQPSAGLFDRIISAIQQEKEFKQTKKLLALFTSLLLVSAISMPFSSAYLLNQWNESAIPHFISTALQNLDLLWAIWQDVSMSILESLPLVSILLFTLNLALLVFTVRLFLHKKGLLLRYLRHNFI